MNTHNTGKKAAWPVLCLAVLAVSCLIYACSDPMGGDEEGKDASFSITINSSGRAVVNGGLSWEPDTKIADLVHTIILTNDSGVKLPPRTDIPAGKTEYFRVAPGHWVITVEAYNENGELKARGSKGVDLKPGYNDSVRIDMEQPMTVINTVEITITAPVKGYPPTGATGTGSYTIGDVLWDPPHNLFQGGIEYTATVTLTANSGHTFTGLSNATINGLAVENPHNTGSTVTLSHTFAKTGTKTVTGIAIKTPPAKMEYTHGDHLDLTGLVVTLTYDDGSTEDVAAHDFADRNITAAPSHGDNLICSTHNGPVKISYGVTCNTNGLTVMKAVPTADDFEIYGTGEEFPYTGNARHVTIIPKDGKSDGAITVKYNGQTTAPSAVGVYTVTFDVAEGTNYTAKSGLNAGILEIKMVTTTINISAIPGITVPVEGEAEVTYIETDQYTGTVEWSPDMPRTRKIKIDMFDSGGNGWDGNGRLRISVVNGDGSFVRVDINSDNNNPIGQLSTHTQTFDMKEGDVVQVRWYLTASDENSFIIYYADTPPVPAFTADNNDSWNGSNALVYRQRGTMGGIANNTLLDSFTVSGGTGFFNARTHYTATITLTPKTGYTLEGVAANFFTVAGAAPVSNSANSGIITAEFPVAVATPVITSLHVPEPSIFTEKTTYFYVEVSSPDDGNLSYQWYSNTTASNSGGSIISGATSYYYDTPNTLTVGTYHYYCVVTNTITDDRGNIKTATVTSEVATITVSLGPGAALLARTVSAGNNSSQFYAVAYDQLGNVYAAGYQDGIGSYTYGASVSVAAGGPYNGYNVVLVKYDAEGNAQWARSVSGGNNSSEFLAVACDQSGNVYAAGYQSGSSTFTYGLGVSATGTSSNNANVVLVKYDANGTAQWAKTVSGVGNNASRFTAVACDPSGNVYAAGYQNNTGNFTYGVGVSAQGNSTGSNVVLVKYDTEGNAQWAKTVSGGNNSSSFYAVACDPSGNVYAAGYQSGTGTLTYGSGSSAQGSYSSTNVVLVKYDTGGNAQWARSVITSNNASRFYAVACDQSGNVYAAGSQNGNETFTYGPNVSARAGYNYGANVVLVKYDTGGNAQWARSVSTAATDESYFSAVACDQSGNVYAAGYQCMAKTFNYGYSVTVAGTSTYLDDDPNNAYDYNGNVVLVKYNPAGVTQWAKSVRAGAYASRFKAVACDQSGSVYAAGYQCDTANYTYGPGVTVAGVYTRIYFSNRAYNAVLVKYKQ